MYRGKFEHPEIRKRYKDNTIKCKNLFIEQENLTNNLKGYNDWKRLFKVNRRIELILDYQIAHYEKAYTLK